MALTKEQLNERRRAARKTAQGQERAKLRYEKIKANPQRKKWLAAYRRANALRLRKYWANYNRTRLESDPQYKLERTLRKRTRQVLARLKISKTFQSGVSFLGCTKAQLKQHIEKQFEPWMTWKNHGKFGWHIDHINPLSSFDLTKPKQFKKACHYTNLRPLGWRENLSKHAKII